MDLLKMLLNRDPTKRLGARGAAEIKLQPFFMEIDWNRLLERHYEPVFKPDESAHSFAAYGVDHAYEPPRTCLRTLFAGWPYTPSTSKSDQKTVSENPSLPETASIAKIKTASVAEVEIEGNWALVWDESMHEFYFHNTVTDRKEPITSSEQNYHTTSAKEGIVSIEDSWVVVPTSEQKKAALEAALKAGYFHSVSQLIDYDLNFNMGIFGRSMKRTSPMEWAVKQENIALLRTFLTKCDAQDLHRVVATRALGVAVDAQNIPLVELLLDHGVKCDFRQSDRHLPVDPDDDGCVFEDPSDPDGFMPPLVRAVKHDNIELAKLLLANGADANIGYHDFSRSQEVTMEEDQTPIHFSCGRVAQLAMELGSFEM
ncbi:Serine/threonine-protein kinase, partial [Kalmusia sp. IMI 367209]